MNYNEFAEKIKAKYPDYKDVDNRVLAEKMIEKHPDYKGVVEFDVPAATQEDPKFYELEKQPGLPRSPIDLIKQAGRQFVEGATSPVPGSMISLPARALQENASQIGAEVARGASTEGGVLPNVGKVAARLLGLGASVATDPTTFMSGGLTLGKGVVAADRAAGVQAAREAGIPLTRAEQSGSRIAASAENFLEKTFTGSDVINSAKSEADNALTIFKDSLKAEHGTPLQPSEVGKVAKQGIEENVQNLKSQAQDIYNALPNVKVQPKELRNASENLIREQLELPKVDRDAALLRRLNEYRNLGLKIEKKLQQVTDDFGFTTEKAKYVKSENPNAYPTSNALKRMSSDLGDAWRRSFKAGETIGNVSGRDATALSSAIQQDIKQIGALRSQLDTANKLYRQAKTLDKNPLVKRLRNAGPEEAANLVFNGKKLTNVILAKSAMGPQAYKAVKGAYFNQLIEHPQLLKQLDGMSPEYLNTVFDAGELAQLRKVAAIQKVRGAASKLQGTNGSARTNTDLLQGGAVMGGLGTALASLAHLNPVGVVGGLGTAATAYYGPKVAAKAYLANGMKGFRVPVAAPGLGQVTERVNTEANTKVDVNRIRQYLLNASRRPGSM